MRPPTVVLIFTREELTILVFAVFISNLSSLV